MRCIEMLGPLLSGPTDGLIGVYHGGRRAELEGISLQD
jgi:hypothetical protein